MRTVQHIAAVAAALLLATADATPRQLMRGVHASAGADCSNLATVFDQVNTRCCNGGRSGSGNHRLLQGNGDQPCVLDTCTQACADVFVSMMTDCASDLPTTGGAFSIISQIQGADHFLATCQNVLNPPAAVHGDHWRHVGGKFMAGDPGMLNSHHFDGSLSSGTGALGWGYWDYDP